MRPLDQLTILVVDDDRDTTESFATWLEMRGAIALKGHSSRDAWALLETIEVDAVVTDIAMPREGGLALARRIRSDQRFQRLPIIAISGVMRTPDAEIVRSAGVDAFHVKPVEPRVLEAAIDQLVRRGPRSLGRA